MFIALFTIAKIWKQPQCVLTDEWIKKYDYYSALNKKDYFQYVATWTHLYDTMLREISQ